MDNGLNGEHAFMGGSMGIKSFPRDTQFYKIKVGVFFGIPKKWISTHFKSLLGHAKSHEIIVFALRDLKYILKERTKEVSLFAGKKESWSPCFK